MSRIRSVLLALLALSSAHCALTPYDGQYVSDYDVEVAGFTDDPTATIKVYGWDWFTDKWFLVDTTAPERSPTFKAGTFCENSPDLYEFDATARLEWPFYWREIDGQNSAKLKATQYGGAGTTIPVYFTSNPDFSSCMIANIKPGCNFGDVAHNICGMDQHEVTVIDSTGHLPFP